MSRSLSYSPWYSSTKWTIPLNDFRSQGIGIAALGFQQDGERFLVNPAPAPELRKTVLMQRMRPVPPPAQSSLQPRFLGGS